LEILYDLAIDDLSGVRVKFQLLAVGAYGCNDRLEFEGPRGRG
jgi:hypothetical protein